MLNCNTVQDIIILALLHITREFVFYVKHNKTMHTTTALIPNSRGKQLKNTLTDLL